MKALVKYVGGKGNVEIQDIPVRDPASDELLIKVRYCGICGTDLHIWADEFPNSPPVVMGHEYCGTVAKVGEAARDRWRVGERVVGELHTGACGTCELCRNGKPHICDRKLALGSKYNGAFAEYLTLPAWLAHPLPDGIPWEVAGVTEPFAITAHCLVERGALQAGQNVLISGAATMGLMATIWASRIGAREIIVTGTAQDASTRFPLAKSLGASRVVNVENEDLSQVVADVTAGCGVDAWIDCSGAVPAISSGLQMVKKTGKVVLIGLVGPAAVPVPWNTILYKELDVAGCFSSPPSSWNLALAAEREEAGKLIRLVSAILPLEQWETGFEMMRKGEVVKILIDMDMERKS
jgi:L-iditol 2-dehydrogenase